jgi:hypothetical protein
MYESKRATRGKGRNVNWKTVPELALDLPGAEEGTSYGTPAVKVQGKLFLRLREDNESFVLRCDSENRELLIAEQPEVFFITDHYLNYPWILVRLSTVRKDQLSDLLRQAWRLAAPKRLVSKMQQTSPH